MVHSEGEPDRRTIAGVKRRSRIVATVSILAVLLLFAAGVSSAVGGERAGEDVVERSGPTDRATATGQIDPRLRDVSGTVTVLVRFADAETDDTVSRSRRIQQLKADTAETQAAFQRYAAERSGITVERSLWLVNGLVVSVDTDAVTLAELAGYVSQELSIAFLVVLAVGSLAFALYRFSRLDV